MVTLNKVREKKQGKGERGERGIRESLRMKDNHDRIISAINTIKLVRKKSEKQCEKEREIREKERERGREIKEKNNQIIIL